MKDLKGDELLWGDEIEYGIFHLDPQTKQIRLSLRAKDVSTHIVLPFAENNSSSGTIIGCEDRELTTLFSGAINMVRFRIRTGP